MCATREGVAPSPTPWCSSYQKGSLRVILDYGFQLFYFYVCKEMADDILRLLYSNTWNHLNMYKKKSSGSFNKIISKMCLQIIYIHYICPNKFWY